MSVFRGSITEYPGVVVDHFTHLNCSRGRAFFLSHCHKDHMTGLSSPQVVEALKRRNSSLYCSEVTRSLLLQDPEFIQLGPFLKGLSMDEPVSMFLEAYTDCPALNFTVTLLPAGHCPGSSMFFYQGSNGSVLYTGDFRLTLEETKRLRSLHCGGRLFDIKALYLDTTFCHPIASTIPSREVSRDIVLKVADSWLSKDPQNVLHLQCNMFGYEHIFMAMAKKFNTKVHIARWRLNAYQGIPAVADCLTTDGDSTRIHCCRRKRGSSVHTGLPCGSRYINGRPPPALSIKPSTLWFLSKSGSLNEPFKYIPEYNVYRVLHSMHASYTEVCDFIGYLKPKRIVPCVIPLGDRTLSDVNVRLKSLLPQLEVITTEGTASGTQILPLDNLVSTATKRKREVLSRDTVVAVKDSDDLSDDTIDEFVSSEEVNSQDLQRTFSNCAKQGTLSNSYTLPSMLTGCASESIILVESKSSHVQGSVGSSGSATIGSLEQTPIDLSPENTPSDSTSFDWIKKKSEDVPVEHTKGDKDAVKEECPKSDHEGFSDYYCKDKGKESASPQAKTSRKSDVSPSESDSQSLSDDGWHLTLESSAAEEDIVPVPEGLSPANVLTKYSDTDAIYADKTATPQAKRTKLNRDVFDRESSCTDTESETDSATSTTAIPTSRKPFRNNNDHCQEARRRSLSVEIIEPRVTAYIDLTQDYQSSSQLSLPDATSCNTAPPAKDILLLTHNTPQFLNTKCCKGNVSSCTCIMTNALPCETSNVANMERSSGQSLKDISLTEHKCLKSDTAIIIGEEEPIVALSQTRDLVPIEECDTIDYEEYTPTSGQGSPLCLPPTPGREGVDSILDRKNIAF